MKFRYFLLLLLAINISACSKLPVYFKPSQINGKVYVMPHKPLQVPSLSGSVDFPEPSSDPVPAKNYVVGKESNPEALTAPPMAYQEPADTAPQGVLGEDEELKQFRNQPNPNIKPSKKSIWGGN